MLRPVYTWVKDSQRGFSKRILKEDSQKSISRSPGGLLAVPVAKLSIGLPIRYAKWTIDGGRFSPNLCRLSPQTNQRSGFYGVV